MRDADNANVKVPRVWFFPKVRMERDLRNLNGYQVIRDGNGLYTRIRDKHGKEISRYSRKAGEYYPRLEMVEQDETVKQAVAPYVVFV